MPGTLYVVATPIGNLQDVSRRVLDTLRDVDLIACEDTRHTGKLLEHFRISNKLTSYHEHNERERAEELADKLLNDAKIALVSDAGTPAISDPGYHIIRRAIEVGATVIAVPGPAAFVAAAVVSGIPIDSLFFGGFLPQKKGERRKRLAEVKDLPATLVFYEAPHRIGRCLVDCLTVLGDRRAAVARELTKLHEETVRGRLSELVPKYEGQKVKGEIVLVVERAPQQERAPGTVGKKELVRRITELEAEGFDPKAALKRAAKEFGLSKSEAYALTRVKQRSPGKK